MRRFSLYRRGIVFYCQFFNPATGKYLPGKSTGKDVYKEAVLVVSEWLKNGLPTMARDKCHQIKDVLSFDAILNNVQHIDLTVDGAARLVSTLKERGLIEAIVMKSGTGTVLLNDYLTTFWTFEKSPYVRDKLLHGHSFGRRHCYENMNRIQKYWVPVFKGRRLVDIQKADLKAFSLDLAESGLATSTVNRIMTAGLTAFHFAYENEMIGPFKSEVQKVDQRKPYAEFGNQVISVAYYLACLQF
jgi:hypothetical protein